MPKEDDPELSKSYDFMYKGIEISSGAQRIHTTDMLIESLKRKDRIRKHSSFSRRHLALGLRLMRGWSIGLERFAMRLTGAKNIREVSLIPASPASVRSPVLQRLSVHHQGLTALFQLSLALQTPCVIGKHRPVQSERPHACPAAFSLLRNEQQPMRRCSLRRPQLLSVWRNFA